MMRIRIALVTCVAALASVAGACTVSFDGSDGSAQQTLDRASLDLSIEQSSATVALVSATIRDGRGRRMTLGDGQSIAINSVVVFAQGFSGGGDSPVAITPASTYTITVTEPTRGVESSTISAPSAFAIASPASGATVSLSGFTISWTGADPTLQADLALSQTIFGDRHDAALGPFTDTGEQTLTAENLGEFQQGAVITIMLSKTTTSTGVAGFASGTATISSASTSSVVVNPGP